MSDDEKGKKVRIALMTFHSETNFGAVLQAYALQRSILDMGCSATFLNYRCKGIDDGYRFRYLFKRAAIVTFKNLIYLPVYLKKKWVFHAFVSKYLQVSNQNLNLSRPSQVARINDQFDAFMVGSDQIWNYRLTAFDEAYFLAFVDKGKMKYAYAASFGVESIPNGLKEEYRRLLQGFQIITAREKSGAGIARELIGKEVETVLDPTLLMDRGKWMQMCQSANVRSGNYILVYLLSKSPLLMESAAQLARMLDCDIVVLNSGEVVSGIPTKSIRVGNPITWIRYVSDAQFIVTNSYHGMLFSLIFAKEFLVECRPTQFNVNSRIFDLLESLGLKDRLVDQNSNVTGLDTIDYARVNPILDGKRTRSLDILQGMLTESSESIQPI